MATEATDGSDVGPDLPEDVTPAVDEDPDEDPDVVTLDPPRLKSRLGTFGKVWKQYKHQRKLQKLAGKGYVRWYLVEDSFPSPKFVKPEKKGGGVRELEHNGQRYLFPREAFLPDRSTGMWTVVHKSGELDPIPLHDPTEYALSADQAEEWLNMRVTSKAPSLFDRIDMDKSDVMTYLIAGIIALAVLQGMFGGGLP
ncbi:hypothetical protein [Halomicrobium urmianum]|uniref:hypothetical protein n=1 Tax=Halomicrobium urmianum TaxID=1586233 RepID=UPI001CD95BC7|nr:hypothetical protein [Halomicrobium urmianum]